MERPGVVDEILNHHPGASDTPPGQAIRYAFIDSQLNPCRNGVQAL